MWKCPNCEREFTRVNQRHSCGTGSTSDLLRNRPDEIVAIYKLIENFVQNLGKVEIVTKERYALFRSKRIFSDLTVMKNCIRIVVHLNREVNDPVFLKTVSDRKHISHVAKLESTDEFCNIQAYLKEAYVFSVSF